MHEVQAFQAERQRWRDVGFLAALGLLLAVSAYAVLRSAYPSHRSHVTTSGEIRAVDPPTLRRQLRSGRLSSREAAHWRRVETGRGKKGGTR